MVSRQRGNRERGTEKKGDISNCQSVIEDSNRCILRVTTVLLRYFGILSIAINLFINFKKIGLAILLKSAQINDMLQNFN